MPVAAGVSLDDALAEVDQPVSISAVPNDPGFGSLYGLNNTGQSGGTAPTPTSTPPRRGTRPTAR